MMKPVALFGLAAGAVLAFGNLTAAQWHAAAAGLLALVLRYGLIVLPWLLAALLGRLWYRAKRRAWLYERMVVAEQSERQRLSAELWDKDRIIERQIAERRKRVTR